MKLSQKYMLVAAFATSISSGAQADSFKDDAVLTKFVEWHLGFTTNAQQTEADLEAKVEPRWGLSELRFQQIWHDRQDGYWLVS